MEILLDFGKSLVLEKTSSKFGNSCHIILPKKFSGKTAKIIFGKTKTSGSKIKLNMFNTEIIERKILSFATSSHVIVPKESLNQKLKIIIRGKDE